MPETRPYVPGTLRVPTNNNAAQFLGNAQASFGNALNQANKTFVTDPNTERATTWKTVKEQDDAKLALARQQAVQGGQASFDQWVNGGQQAALAGLQQAGWQDQTALAQANLDTRNTNQPQWNQTTLDQFVGNQGFSVDDTKQRQAIYAKATSLGEDPAAALAQYDAGKANASQFTQPMERNKEQADFEYNQQVKAIDIAREQSTSQYQREFNVDPSTFNPPQMSSVDLGKQWENVDQLSDVTSMIGSTYGLKLTNNELSELYNYGVEKDGWDWNDYDHADTDKVKSFVDTIKANRVAKAQKQEDYEKFTTVLDKNVEDAKFGLKQSKADFDRQQFSNAFANSRNQAFSPAQYVGNPTFDSALNTLNTVGRGTGEPVKTEAVAENADPSFINKGVAAATENIKAIFSGGSSLDGIDTEGFKGNLYDYNADMDRGFFASVTSGKSGEGRIQVAKKELEIASNKLTKLSESKDSTLEEIQAQEQVVSDKQEAAQATQLLADINKTTGKKAKGLYSLENKQPKPNEGRLGKETLQAGLHIIEGTPIDPKILDKANVGLLASKVIPDIYAKGTAKKDALLKVLNGDTTGDFRLDDIIKQNVLEAIQQVDPTYTPSTSPEQGLRDSLNQGGTNTQPQVNTPQAAVFPTNPAQQGNVAELRARGLGERFIDIALRSAQGGSLLGQRGNGSVTQGEMAELAAELKRLSIS